MTAPLEEGSVPAPKQSSDRRPANGAGGDAPTPVARDPDRRPDNHPAADTPTGALDLAARLALQACAEHDGRPIEPAASPKSPGGYEILEELGRGGQGVVYLARDPQLGRDVALKVLGWTTGPEEQRRLRREAEITARLDLPEVCKIFEIGQFNGGTFVAMQRVSGDVVARRIQAAGGRGPVDLGADGVDRTPGDRGSIETVLRFVAKVARAVHRVHLEGVVHRDLKPANLMVTADGAPVILDFGLARAEDHGLESLTATGDVFGTPAYMAPELLKDEPRPADRGSDIWALGCILWELLFAQRLFAAPTRSALLEAIRARPLPNPRSLLPGLPPELEAVLEVALERDLARRYSTAAALAEDLERVVRLEPVQARRGSWMLRTQRAVQRHPLRITAAVLAILLITVTPTAVAVQSRIAAAAIREQQQRSEGLADLALNAISDTLVELGDSALAELPGEVERRRRVLARAEQLLLDLESDPTAASSVPRQRIEIHFGLALLGDGTRREIDAERHMTTVLELLARHPNADLTPERRLQIERNAYGYLASTLIRRGSLGEAEKMLARAEAHPDLRDDRFSRAGFLHARARIAQFRRDPESALELADSAARELEAADAAAVEIPPHHDIERAEIQISRSGLLRTLRRYEEAAAVLDPALAAFDERPPARHAINQRFTLTSCLNERALALMVVERFEAAKRDIDRAVRIHDELLALAPGNPDFLFQAGQSRVIRSDLLRRMGSTASCEADVREAFGLLRRDVPRLADSAQLSISFLRSLMRLDFVARTHLPKTESLQEEMVARAVAIGHAALERFPDSGRLLSELSAAVRRLAALRASHDDLETALAILQEHCELLEDRLGADTEKLPAAERYRCLQDLGQLAERREDHEARHRAWTSAHDFALLVAAEEAPSRLAKRAPYYALQQRLAAAFELGLWDEIEAACGDPMLHLADYMATLSDEDAAERWTRHALYTGSKRFLDRRPLGDWALRLRLMGAVYRLHGALLEDGRAEGDVWDRARARLRARWIGLGDAAFRDLATMIARALTDRRGR